LLFSILVTVNWLLVVTGDEAGEFELAAPGKLPDKLVVSVWLQTFCIRIVVLHVRILLHDFRVLAILHDRREDEFVILLAVVLQNETDLFPPSHLDARRRAEEVIYRRGAILISVKSSSGT
jgi:hypothetical protein